MPLSVQTSSDAIDGNNSYSTTVNSQKLQNPVSQTIFLPPPAQQAARRDHFIRSSGEDIRRSKQSLRGSRHSSEKVAANDSSDDDSFEDRRSGFQKQKTISIDRKGILKVRQ